MAFGRCIYGSYGNKITWTLIKNFNLNHFFSLSIKRKDLLHKAMELSLFNLNFILAFTIFAN